MMDNIRQIIREEDGIRAEAASKIKARIKANVNKNDIDSMKSLLNKRIAAKKIGATIKQKAVQQEYNETTEAAKKLGAAIKQRAIQQKYIEAPGAATKIQKVVRGHKIRKQLPEIIEEHDRQQIIKKINETEQRANKIGDAAITIQKRFRQNKRKTTPITISNEPQTSTINPTNLIADNVSRNVIKNSLNKIVRKQNAATTLQNAIRTRTAKRDMMKQRQLVGEEQLRQMEEEVRQREAAKAKAIKDANEASNKIQNAVRNRTARKEMKQQKIKKATDKIGAVTKRLLTRKIDTYYNPNLKKAFILNKDKVGQRLVVNKRNQLVSKKKHDAGVFGYETRQDFLDLAKTYKPIMTKGQKK
jgi:hypothetical protein